MICPPQIETTVGSPLPTFCLPPPSPGWNIRRYADFYASKRQQQQQQASTAGWADQRPKRTLRRVLTASQQQLQPQKPASSNVASVTSKAFSSASAGSSINVTVSVALKSPESSSTSTAATSSDGYCTTAPVPPAGIFAEPLDLDDAIAGLRARIAASASGPGVDNTSTGVSSADLQPRQPLPGPETLSNSSTSENLQPLLPPAAPPPPAPAPPLRSSAEAGYRLRNLGAAPGGAGAGGGGGRQPPAARPKPSR